MPCAGDSPPCSCHSGMKHGVGSPPEGTITCGGRGCADETLQARAHGVGGVEAATQAVGRGGAAQDVHGRLRAGRLQRPLARLEGIRGAEARAAVRGHPLLAGVRPAADMVGMSLKVLIQARACLRTPVLLDPMRTMLPLLLLLRTPFSSCCATVGNVGCWQLHVMASAHPAL